MIKFSEWLKNRETTSEMTTSGSAGGMTSTADIANYARPLIFDDKENKKTHLIRRIKKEKY